MFAKSPVILLTSIAWAAAPASFNSPEVLAPQAVGVVAADFNHDGNLDLAVLNSTRLLIRLGNGKGGFSLKAEYAMPLAIGGQGDIQLAAADLDRNGHLDLVALNSGASDNVAVLLGRGDGTFAAPAFYSVAASPISVAIADFNGDGKPDLAVSSYLQIVTILLNGAGTFTPTGSVPTGFTTNFAAADFNGDGYADLALSPGIALGKGDGTFLPPLPYELGGTVSPVLAVDLNADGKPDLLANVVSGGLAVFLGKGDGTMHNPFILRSWSASALAAGDFNNDGHIDVAGVTFSDTFVLLNDGHGGLIPPPASSPAGQFNYALTVGDFNGDGKLDLAAAGAATTILQGDGRGGLQQATSYPVLGADRYNSGIAAGDLNGDGLPDFVEASGTHLSTVFNDGQSGYVQGPVYELPNVASVAILGDFNGDGYLDVAVAMPVQNKVAVLLNKGDGTFGAPVYYSAVLAAASFAIGEFNGDGKLDLAVGGIGLAVLLGNGDGTFQLAAHYTIGGSLASLTLADFNADNHPDLVAANGTSVVVLLGNGDGSFRPPAYIVTGERAYSLAAADLNGDGKSDLAVVGFAADDSSVLAVLLGNGDGSFKTPVHYTGFNGAAQVAIADFNRDGAPDLAVLCGNSFSVSILLGDGAGRFQNGLEGIGFLAPTFPVYLTVADLNGDGRPDIALNTSSPNGLVVLTNTTR